MVAARPRARPSDKRAKSPSVLLTGFDPFGGDVLNPSWLIAQALHRRQLAGHRIIAAQLPTVFGDSLTRLNALLGCATVLPALTRALPMLELSGVLFGAVFLSVVASTTALVRHNLPQAQWASGISGFTIVFALGQIVGPTVVGWIADGPGGLARGLVFSAVALWLGALLAWRQKALAPG